MGRMLWTLLLAALLGGCEQDTAPADEMRMRSQFHLYDFEKTFGYAQAVKVGHTLYVSSVFPVDAEGRLVGPGDMKTQLEAVYSNLDRTLEAYGATFEHVVREDIATTDMNQLLALAPMRFDYYSESSLPVASWVQVERLLDEGFLVQISVTAELP